MGYDIPADHHGPLPSIKPAEPLKLKSNEMRGMDEAGIIDEEKFAALRPLRLSRMRAFDPSNIYDAYTRWTDSVAKYPVTAEPYYLALGIADECGELAGARGYEDTLKEAGDCLWYCSRYSVRVLRVPFSDLVDDLMKCDTFANEITTNIGIITGVEKKRIRDGADWDEAKTLQKESQAYKALINVMCWIHAHLRYAGMTLEDALNANQGKLNARAEAGTIQGDGDHR